jgi:hypothetical protein
MRRQAHPLVLPAGQIVRRGLRDPATLLNTRQKQGGERPEIMNQGDFP